MMLSGVNFTNILSKGFHVHAGDIRLLKVASDFDESTITCTCRLLLSDSGVWLRWELLVAPQECHDSSGRL